MSFDPAWLFLSLIPGAAGFDLCVYGKKQQRWPQLTAGLLLLVYPYFTTSVLLLLGVGLLIALALRYAVRLGW